MARPWRIRYAGARYHVTVRGNGRQLVFHGEEYYLRFLEQLAEALEKDQVILYAYCLMPNHYHLFIETPLGNIQRFMQRLNTAYSMYHRYKKSEPGHCFQGRYGAKLVRGDAYILGLTRYIHLNPVKVAACKGKDLAAQKTQLNGCRWSSYRGYVDTSARQDMVDYRWLDLMGCRSQKANRMEYRKYIEKCISTDDAEFKAALEVSRYAVGDKEFIEEVESDLESVRENKGVYGDIKWPEGKSLSLDDISVIVAQEFKVDKEQLKTMCYAARLAKKVALELSCRYSNQSQRKVGEYYGYRGNGSVMKQRQKLRDLLKDDSGLKKRIGKIEKRLARI
ncbi:MAG: transposase [Kiritimatiellia bacterium]